MLEISCTGSFNLITIALTLLDIFLYYTTSNFYPINLEDFSDQHVLTHRVENNVDPDQLASEKPADQDLHCFQNGIYICIRVMHGKG